MWTITHDCIEEGKCIGRCSCDFEEAKEPSLIHRFRMLDADGETYFEGVSDDATSQRAFDPLDDFGRGYAGCVEIQYQAEGVWKPL